MKELVISLVSKLQRDVYFANRTSLYNQDGVGLNFALQNGAENPFEKGEYAFYYNLFVQNLNASESGSDHPSQNSDQLPDVALSSKSSEVNGKQVCGFNIPEKFENSASPYQLEFHSELKETLDQMREAASDETPWALYLSTWARQLLW